MGIEIGQTVGGYQVVALLGRGGMGKVFRVRNVISDRVDAMKVLLGDTRATPDLSERFLREIKVVASLEHPNIAALRTAFKVDDQLVMIMELVEGLSLDDQPRGGRLNPVYAVDCTCQVLQLSLTRTGRAARNRVERLQLKFVGLVGAYKLWRSIGGKN